ncbi:DNA internalization-related competence protein ComEC/Rec2 [Deinococcus reticulitermitis]|nr:DNA internalization-related competence protein ComEC/Rec2 [Deinococcus reticulitermitis]
MIGGILLALGSGWGALGALLGVGLAAFDRRLSLVAAALLGAGLGWGSASLQGRAGDPLAPWVGALVTLEGEWDGQFLTLSEPRARVALAPRPLEGPGRLTVSGRLIRPEGRRTPGGFDQAAWLRSQGGLLVPTPGTVLVRAAVRSHTPERGLRGWFRRGVTAGLPAREAALMQAVELGERGDIGRETFAEGFSVRDAFARAGLAHLMALSGQNVALLTGAVIVVLGLLGARPAVRYGLPALLLPVYLVCLVGLSPSITRAVLMGFAGLLALVIGRGKPDPLGTVALAASACLLLFPLWLLDVGFQLSFLAVLGLLLSPRAAARLPERWPGWLRLALSATVLAELATLPVIAHHFGQLPLVGLPANLLAAPIMAALVPLGALAGVLGPAGGIVNWLVGPLAAALLWVAQTFGSLPVLSWGQLAAGGFVAYSVAALAGTLWLLGRVRGRAALLTALACAALCWLPGTLRPARELAFLDVGQGDATLLRVPGLTMLVDGGGSVGSDYDVGKGAVLPALRALGVRDLDVVVATHADTDHIEGLPSVLRALPVGEVWVGQLKQAGEDPVLDALIAAARERGVPVREVRRGDQVSAAGVKVTVLWPQGRFWSTEDNDNSVALRVEAGEFRAALLGDLADPAEALIGAGDLTLLKAAHHGSRYSTGETLLRQTTPRDVLISVGRNTYGHPTQAVLDRIAAAGARVWRTDHTGTVRWPLP